MSNKYVKVKIPLPEKMDNEKTREKLGDLIVERIVERTTQGKDVDGKSFPKYTDGYKNSLDFKVSGKSGNVDLQLSGDMLAALTVLRTEPSFIEIGFDDDSVEGRAEGNIRGTYGKKRGNRDKARDFLGTSGFTSTKGISDKDLAKLVKYVKSSK